MTDGFTPNSRNRKPNSESHAGRPQNLRGAGGWGSRQPSQGHPPATWPHVPLTEPRWLLQAFPVWSQVAVMTVGMGLASSPHTSEVPSPLWLEMSVSPGSVVSALLLCPPAPGCAWTYMPWVGCLLPVAEPHLVPSEDTVIFPNFHLPAC